VGPFREALRQGKSGIDWLTRFDRSLYRAQCAGEIHDFDASQFFLAQKLRRVDRYAQMAMAASELACRDANLVFTPEQPQTDVGISFGTALGGVAGAEDQHRRFISEGLKAIPAALALQVFGGSAHSNIAIAYGLRGYATTNSNSCASGTVAVGEAWRAIRDGYVDVMLAGAAEAPLSPLTFGAFDVIRSMSPQMDDPHLACRPFDRNRDGFVMAEGAAVLILEEAERAQKRGARIYAEVLGYALNNDAYNMVSSLPEGESAIAAMDSALVSANVKPEQIGYINAHASSTPMNDAHEAKAIQKFFGKHRPMVSGTKGYYGHSLGAAGAIEALICSLTVAEGFIPATLGCREPDVPEGFNLVWEKSRQQPVDYVLSNSFGFGGINATLVLGRAR
jgi:3-oxoacyl-[acyl-carrier-protein] synthase II